MSSYGGCVPRLTATVDGCSAFDALWWDPPRVLVFCGLCANSRFI